MPELVTDMPVLVTGAGGWLASHVIYQLLEKGYKIRGTVRDLNSKKYTFLKSPEFHPLASSAVELVEADLLKDDGWNEAVTGCEYVLHVASPFTFKYKDQEKELIEPAIKGVERVLTACFNSNSVVKRIVQTSSVCSVVFGHSADRYRCSRDSVETAKSVWNEECFSERYSNCGKENVQQANVGGSDAKATDEGEPCCASDPFLHVRTKKPVPAEWASWRLMDESDWSVPETIRGYELSKVLAEKRAWSLIKELNSSRTSGSPIELVTMCPGFIFGPLFAAEQASGESTTHILRLLNRAYPVVPAINSSHVDVRDAAACHILGMEKPSDKVSGKRFMVTCDDGNLNFTEQAELLARNMNKFGYCIPTATAPRFITTLGGYFSTSIATAADKLDCVSYVSNKDTHDTLGLTEWRTAEGALYAHAMSLIKFGVAKSKKTPTDIVSGFKAY